VAAMRPSLERAEKGEEAMAAQTVWGATYDLLRSSELTTVFGNPGSTEQPFLKNFPADFQYILGLQEASVVAMADGFAQATGRPALVNLHTSAGTGNGMGNIMTAFLNKTPLILTAGQQTREMILCDPLLTNRDETMLPRPYVKWAYQPARAEDVPGAIMRAYAMALQPPAARSTYRFRSTTGISLRSAPRSSAQSASASRQMASACANSPSASRLRRGSPSSTGKRSSGAAVGTPALSSRRSSMRRCSMRRSPSARPFPRRTLCSRGCSRSPWGLWPPASTATISWS
jgi:hypothetical protein